MSGPYFVVLNARSGSRAADEVPRSLHRAFSAAGRHFEIFHVQNGRNVNRAAQRAAEQARREKGALVVAGGDGTIRCVAEHALAVGRPLGILPRGTFNYTSRTHGIPLDLDDAVDALLNTRVRPIQVGMVNGHAFLLNASLGLYPELLEEREQYKRRFGRRRAVAFAAGLVTLLREHGHLTLRSEHDLGRELVRAATVFVGNNALQLAQVGLPEAAAVGDGKLAAVFVEPVSRLRRLALLARGLGGKLAGGAGLRNFAFETLEVAPRHGTHELKVALDGEILRLRPPLCFSVAAKPLRLLTPAKVAALEARGSARARSNDDGP